MRLASSRTQAFIVSTVINLTISLKLTVAKHSVQRDTKRKR